MKQMTLPVKITLAVGLTETLACVVLTLNSILSANSYYGWQEDIQRLQREQNRDPALAILPDYTPSTLFTAQNIIVMVLVIAVSVLLTYWLTKRLLSPLTNLNASIRQISGRNLHDRVELTGADGEVHELTQSFNGMLERLEDSFAIQKNFAANAAHELKTPLAAISTSLQVLEMDASPTEEDYRVFAARTKASLTRLIKTMDGLIALTNELVDDRREAVSLWDVVMQIRLELAPQSEALSLEVTVSGADQTVCTDRALIYRAFYNLMENAVKYNRQGGSLDVILSKTEGYAIVELTDTGIGMSSETLSHLFEPFYRADESRSQKIPGSGLGMAIVKAILDLYHGKITVDSQEGRGSRIIISLPLHDK